MFENGEFLIMKWEWLEESLSPEELNILFNCLIKASEDKEEKEINKMMEDVKKELTKDDERPLDVYNLGKKISKEEVLKCLKELQECDLEISLIEALEVLLKYVNDKEINKSFDGIRDKTFLRNIE